MKFEIIQACESGNVSKSGIGRRYNLSSSTLYDPKKQRQN
jgi:transposase-like protein